MRCWQMAFQATPFELSYREISAVHHVISQELSARLRRIHDPLADKITERLGGAAAERAVARSAIQTRHREFVGETKSAVQLDRLAGDPVGHLVARDLGHRRHERIGKRIGSDTGAIEDAAGRLDLAVHLSEFPAHALIVTDRLSEHRSVPDIFAGFFKSALGQPKRYTRIEAALRVEGVQQLSKAVVANYEILQRQFAIVKLDLVKIFPAHRMVGPGHLETWRIWLQQNAADALAAGPAVDPRENDEHAGLPGPAD